MREMLTLKQSELIEYHERNGVIDVRKLPVGTRVELHTPDEHYELEVGTPKFGVVLVASDGRFNHRDKVVVPGSIDPDTFIFLPNIIGEGLKVMLRPQNQPIVRTGPVISARILGKHDSYVYEMWRD